MANLRILTDVEAFPLCRNDAFGINKTRTVLAALPGREAYWSAHSYGQAAFIHAFDRALTSGLHVACREIAEWRPDQAAANIAAFIAGIFPANAAARAALIAAEAEWLATFSDQAA